MSTNRADALGALSLLVALPSWWSSFRFLCASCAREGSILGGNNYLPTGFFDREELIAAGAKVLLFGKGEEWLKVATLEPPHIQIRRRGGVDLVLPFDPLAFGVHLLHEVRPEFDNRLIAEPVLVQDVTEFEKHPLMRWEADYDAIRASLTKPKRDPEGG